MKTFAFLLAALLCLALPVHAERRPATMGQDARVRAVWYNASDVIRIDTNLRVNTAIELGSGERIEQVLLGDSESYEIEVLSNRSTISVKPVIAGAASNMTVYTSRRAIAFALTEGRSNTPTYRVALKYPDTARKTKTRLAGQRDTGFEYAGSSHSRPLAVWSDGRATFFEFRPGVRPSIFAVDARGYELSVNSQTRGNVVRVPGNFGGYTIRLGEDVICIRHVAGGVTAQPATVALLAQKEF